MKKIIKNNWILITILLIFGLLYSSISLVNHYFFRTSTLDLGLMNQIMYNLAHFKSAVITLYYNDLEVQFLGDHFSPIFNLFAPFYFIFGSYTLLVIQIASILFGGIGIYKYAEYKNPGKYFKHFHLVHFLGIWGIFSALAFDFHTNVVAAMLVPWLIYHYERKEYKQFFIYYVLIILCKENMALWMFFILLGLSFKPKFEGFKSLLRFEIPLMFFTLLYFVMVVIFIMPAITNSVQNLQIIRYQHLGSSFGEIFLNLISDPRQTFSLLFDSTNPSIELTGIKTETLFMLLVSGGFVFFKYPRYLIMILPIYFQKMLSLDWVAWGLNGQYSIEFVPILAIALIDFVANYENKKIANWILIGTIYLTYHFNVSSLDHRKSQWYNKINSAFFQSEHYKSNLNINEINKELAKLPAEIPISVGASLSPHLTNRSRVYMFPVVKDAEYIVLFSSQIECYPFSREKFEEEILKLKTSINFEIIYDKNELMIFRRK